jgi:hypothetical protein
MIGATERRKQTLVLGIVFLAVAIPATAVYLAGCATTVQGMDSGEFMTVAAGGGRLHPPGYPVAMYLMQLAQLLPVDNPIWKASAVSAVFGGLALGLQAIAIQLLSGRALFAVVLPLVLGCSPLWLRYGTVAEVFTPGAFAMSALALLAVRVHMGMQGARTGIWLGLIGGFAFANHHGFVFAFPLMAWILWAGKAGWRGLACVFLAGSWGLAAYIPLLWAEGSWAWGELDSIGGLVGHVLRRDYGSFSLRASALGEVHWWDNPLEYLRIMPAELSYVLPIMMAAGLWSARRKPLAWALAAGWLSSSLGFLCLFNIPPEGEAAVIAQRFMVPPSALALPLAAMVERKLLSWIPARALFALLPFIVGSMHFGKVDHAQDRRMDDFLGNACSVTPPGSILFTENDGLVFGLLYAQEIEGMCPGVTAISRSLLRFPWYRDRLKRTDPSLDLSEPEFTAIARRHVGERPVFAAITLLSREEEMRRLPPAVPYGGVWMRLLGPEDPLPHPSQVEKQLLDTMRRYRWSPIPRHPFILGRTAESWTHQQYGESWMALSRAYSSAGRRDDAERCRVMGEALKIGFWPWKGPAKEKPH